jgi:very-short-patch-repair endonuclease
LRERVPEQSEGGRGAKPPADYADAMPKRPDDPVPNLLRAKELRAAQTPPEIVFWSRVRAHRLHGLKFKRQHPIGPYIADFYCAQSKMVIELDGRTHEHDAPRDLARDAWMHERGLLVIRISVSLLSKDPDTIIGRVGRIALERMRLLEHPGDTEETPLPPPPAGPSPSRGEGGRGNRAC